MAEPIPEPIAERAAEEPIAAPPSTSLTDSKCAMWYKDSYTGLDSPPEDESCSPVENLKCHELNFIVDKIISAGINPGDKGVALITNCPDSDLLLSDKSCADLTIASLDPSSFGTAERQRNILLTKKKCLLDAMSKDIDGSKFSCDGLKRTRVAVEGYNIPSFNYLIPEFQQALNDLGSEVYDQVNDECLPPPTTAPPTSPPPATVGFLGADASASGEENEAATTTAPAAEEGISQTTIGIIIAVVCCVCLVVGYILTRKINGKKEVKGNGNKEGNSNGKKEVKGNGNGNKEKGKR